MKPFDNFILAGSAEFVFSSAIYLQTTCVRNSLTELCFQVLKFFGNRRQLEESFTVDWASTDAAYEISRPPLSVVDAAAAFHQNMGLHADQQWRSRWKRSLYVTLYRSHNLGRPKHCGSPFHYHVHAHNGVRSLTPVGPSICEWAISRLLVFAASCNIAARHPSPGCHLAASLLYGQSINDLLPQAMQNPRYSDSAAALNKSVATSQSINLCSLYRVACTSEN